jgi:hypothetical protein
MKNRLFMKSMLFSIVGLCLFLYSCSQTSKEDYLIGKWIVYKTTDQNESEYNPYGEKFDNRTDTIVFKENNIIEVYWMEGEPPDVAEYKFENDSILRLGNRLYKFFRIDDERMVLSEYSPRLPEIKVFF